MVLITSQHTAVSVLEETTDWSVTQQEDTTPPVSWHYGESIATAINYGTKDFQPVNGLITEVSSLAKDSESLQPKESIILQEGMNQRLLQKSIPQFKRSWRLVEEIWTNWEMWEDCDIIYYVYDCILIIWYFMHEPLWCLIIGIKYI